MSDFLRFSKVDIFHKNVENSCMISLIDDCSRLSPEEDLKSFNFMIQRSSEIAFSNYVPLSLVSSFLRSCEQGENVLKDLTRFDLYQWYLGRVKKQDALRLTLDLLKLNFWIGSSELFFLSQPLWNLSILPHKTLLNIKLDTDEESCIWQSVRDILIVYSAATDSLFRRDFTIDGKLTAAKSRVDNERTMEDVLNEISHCRLFKNQNLFEMVREKMDDISSVSSMLCQDDVLEILKSRTKPEYIYGLSDCFSFVHNIKLMRESYSI